MLLKISGGGLRDFRRGLRNFRGGGGDKFSSGG